MFTSPLKREIRQFDVAVEQRNVQKSVMCDVQSCCFGRCSSREVLNKSQCMEFLSAGTKKSGRFKVERWPLAEDRLY